MALPLGLLVHSDFNYDFNVSFTPAQIAAGNAYHNFGQIRADTWPAGLEDLSGDSVFFKDDAGRIFHTWARPRNMYGKGGMVEANGRYHAPSCACAVHK